MLYSQKQVNIAFALFDGEIPETLTPIAFCHWLNLAMEVMGDDPAAPEPVYFELCDLFEVTYGITAMEIFACVPDA